MFDELPEEFTFDNDYEDMRIKAANKYIISHFDDVIIKHLKKCPPVGGTVLFKTQIERLLRDNFPKQIEMLRNQHYHPYISDPLHKLIKHFNNKYYDSRNSYYEHEKKNENCI